MIRAVAALAMASPAWPAFRAVVSRPLWHASPHLRVRLWRGGGRSESARSSLAATVAPPSLLAALSATALCLTLVEAWLARAGRGVAERAPAGIARAAAARAVARPGLLREAGASSRPGFQGAPDRAAAGLHRRPAGRAAASSRTPTRTSSPHRSRSTASCPAATCAIATPPGMPTTRASSGPRSPARSSSRRSPRSARASARVSLAAAAEGAPGVPPRARVNRMLFPDLGGAVRRARAGCCRNASPAGALPRDRHPQPAPHLRSLRPRRGYRDGRHLPGAGGAARRAAAGRSAALLRRRDPPPRPERARRSSGARQPRLPLPRHVGGRLGPADLDRADARRSPRRRPRCPRRAREGHDANASARECALHAHRARDAPPRAERAHLPPHDARRLGRGRHDPGRAGSFASASTRRIATLRVFEHPDTFDPDRFLGRSYSKDEYSPVRRTPPRLPRRAGDRSRSPGSSPRS